MIFFHRFASHGEIQNTIWEMPLQNEDKVKDFQGLLALGILYFSRIYKASNRDSIDSEIIRVASYFPMLDAKACEDLFRPISEEKVASILGTFQTNHSVGSDGCTIEFYIDFFDLLGDNWLRVVEGVQPLSNFYGSINATFLALIPKVDCPTSFKEFQPISLCNCLYKIFSKIIVVCLKHILYEYIYEEQFGFLVGRQIHQAVGSTQEGLHSLKIGQFLMEMKKKLNFLIR